MDAVDHLLTIAEISVAIAGFAGIIATFQFQQIEHVSRGRVLAVWMIVNISLCMAFFSVLPFALINLGLEEWLVWSISSTLIGICSVVGSPFIIRNMSLQRETLPLRILFRSLPVVQMALVVVNFLNAFGILFDHEAGPFLVIIIFSLSIVCYNFSRLLVRPLWKMVELREAINSDSG